MKYFTRYQYQWMKWPLYFSPIVINSSVIVFSGCLSFTSLTRNAFVHTWVCCADSSQYRHMTRILKSQTWLSVSLEILHAGDTARLSECCFSAIRSGTTNQWIQCSSHDRLQILRLQGLARQAFVALLLVLLFWALVYSCMKRLNCQPLRQYPPAWKTLLLSGNCLHGFLFVIRDIITLCL